MVSESVPNASHRTEHNYNGPRQNINFGRDQYANDGGGVIITGGIHDNAVVQTSTRGGHKTHKTLWDAVAGVGASHKAEKQHGREECLEGTRGEVLGIIQKWRLSESKALPICWLSGATGVGKSSIALTVAGSCEKDGLLASFFFVRSDPNRNHPSALMLSIAHGLTMISSSLRDTINEKITADPSILEAKLERQLQELVLEPLLKQRWRRSLAAFGAKIGFTSKYPNLVVIDGLDECGDEDTQVRILKILAAPHQRSPYHPLRFLVCSRPEAWMRETLDTPTLRQYTKHIELDDSRFMHDRDIARYRDHEFGKIREDPKYRHLCFPKPWPSKEDSDLLLRNSSGQFVYIATAVKFVKLRSHDPIDQLQIIIDRTPQKQSSQSPFATLDALYGIVVSTSSPDALRPILAAILILPPHAPTSPKFIEFVLGLPQGHSYMILRTMHSVLNIRDPEDDIHIYHQSFNEFLLDHTRSEELHIEKPIQHCSLVRHWFRELGERLSGRKDSYDLFLDTCTRILFTKWTDFCSSLSEPSQDVVNDLLSLDLSILFAASLAPVSTFSTSKQAFESRFSVLELEKTERRHSPGWHRTFGKISSWLQKSTTTLDSAILDRFVQIPQHFHVELPAASPLETSDVIHWIILSITGCEWVSTMTKRVDTTVRKRVNAAMGKRVDAFNTEPVDIPMTSLRLAACRCGGSGPMDVAFHRLDNQDEYHINSRFACLQTARALMLPDSTSFESSDAYVAELDAILSNLVDSSLLQSCAFGPELLSICRALFSSEEIWVFFSQARSGLTRLGRREKLLEWFKTFPDEYTEEVRNLRAEFESIFSD